jgi:DNA-binding transcriptional MerR regulator
VQRDHRNLRFEAACVTRLRTIGRLRRDLGINLPGIAAVLELLDRVQSLQRELDTLRFRSHE